MENQTEYTTRYNQVSTTTAYTRFVEKFAISPREQDILRLVLEGKNTQQMCDALYISENTVKTHIRHLLRKTDSQSRTALTALFYAETE